MRIDCVVENRFLPYESTDPERPGMVHAILMGHRLVCSSQAFDQLKRLSDRGPDEFDAGFLPLLRELGAI